MNKNTDNSNIQQTADAVNILRNAILQSQARAVKAVNQEQLALYFGIGRYISANTRNKNWGSGVIESISNQLQLELPGLRGFGVRQLKNMRSFYEAWNMLESNSAIAIADNDDNSAITIAELGQNLSVATDELIKASEDEHNTIRQLRLANLENFPLVEFFSVSFTHHIRIIENVKDLDERLFYIRYCHNYKPTTDALPKIIRKQDFRQPMGVATYKTADEMDEEFKKVLPPKELLEKLLEG